jgi:hypothetical protein
MTASRTATGRCLCSAVSYRVNGPLRECVACHCSQCRRSSGNFVVATSAASGDLAVDGSEKLAWHRSSDAAERGFCRECGSNLFWRRFGGDRTSIMAGTVDPPTGLSVALHIFVADKSDFYDITDDAPRHDAW